MEYDYHQPIFSHNVSFMDIPMTQFMGLQTCTTSSPHFIEMLNGDTFAWGNVVWSSLSKKAVMYNASIDDRALHLFLSFLYRENFRLVEDFKCDVHCSLMTSSGH